MHLVRSTPATQPLPLPRFLNHNSLQASSAFKRSPAEAADGVGAASPIGTPKMHMGLELHRAIPPKLVNNSSEIRHLYLPYLWGGLILGISI